MRPARLGAVALVATLVLGACTDSDDRLRPEGSAGVSDGSGGAAQAEAPLATTATVGLVAGTLDPTAREEVKTAITTVVDGYLDAAFVGGTWPRDDFSAAFADFTEGAAADASERDLDLLTNHAIGAGLTGVTATKRRVRIDLLSPRGRPGAATARFAVEFETAGDAADTAGTQRVEGSLFLTRHRGAWRVFGYDVHQEEVS